MEGIDCSTAFKLADASVMSSDASMVRLDLWEALTRKGHQGTEGFGSNPARERCCHCCYAEPSDPMYLPSVLMFEMSYGLKLCLEKQSCAV